jgi:hypothetical protein
MFATIINDCRDANAYGRQITRINSLLSCPASLVGVETDVEASGMLVDILDAAEGREGVVLVNVAPREKTKNKWENGTPFGYFYVGNTLVCSSIGGETLRLISELDITNSIEVFDIPTVMKQALAYGLVDEKKAQSIINTQFRSFEFLPRIATWLIKKYTFESTTLSLKDHNFQTHNQVWWVDCFGNCKTTRLATKEPEQSIETAYGTLPFYTRLTDVPDGTIACVQGSSGFGDKRLIEIVIQGGNAAQKLHIHSGDTI